MHCVTSSCVMMMTWHVLLEGMTICVQYKMNVFEDVSRTHLHGETYELKKYAKRHTGGNQFKYFYGQNATPMVP